MTWHSGLLEWRDDTTVNLSVVFSWQLQTAFSRAIWWRSLGMQVRAGGPAVALNPGFLADVAEIGDQAPDALTRHNPDATFTTRGCIRSCPFCAVPKIEGDLVELDDWEPRPIVCDNNLLAASHSHFNRVIDRLKPVPQVDFNQGLDARLLTNHHAARLAELDLYAARLAWDDTRTERQFMVAFEKLRRAGIPARKIRVYCLIGFNDTPEDAYYRLEAVRSLGTRPNPMRYQPLNVTKRDGYISPNWTEGELKRFTRYYSRLRWLEHIPFKEYNR